MTLMLVYKYTWDGVCGGNDANKQGILWQTMIKLIYICSKLNWRKDTIEGSRSRDKFGYP